MINNIMSLEYYLFCRKRYDNVINFLKEINYENELFLNETLKLDINDVRKYNIDLSNHIEEYKFDLKFFIELRNDNEKKIYELCEHDFEDDYIDITPERSEKITYCVICECSK